MGVSFRVVEWLRSAGHDAVHLREQHLQRLPDPDVLAKAAVEGRILLTFDLDFGELLALRAGADVSVVVFRLRNTRPDHVIARLQTVLARSAPALMDGAIIVVDDGLHRVRKLPVGISSP
jgi:predicted nuclease of predicted toxin-antitoxin system